MEVPSEEALIEAAKRSPQAFAPLYELHFEAIFRFIQRRARDRDLSADLTQQTFLKAMLALPRYEPRGFPIQGFPLPRCPERGQDALAETSRSGDRS